MNTKIDLSWKFRDYLAFAIFILQIICLLGSVLIILPIAPLGYYGMGFILAGGVFKIVDLVLF